MSESRGDESQSNGNDDDPKLDEIIDTTRSVGKGFGLKKWRRIRRDHVSLTKETLSQVEQLEKFDSDSDSTAGRMLKRVLNVNHNENDCDHASASDSAPIPIPIPIPFPPTTNLFNVGADSDNSEDSHTHRSSSKSSTAATYHLRPHLHLHLHRHHKDDNGNNNNNNNNMNPNQADPSKKPRGGLDLSSSTESQQQQQQQQQSVFNSAALSSDSSDQLSSTANNNNNNNNNNADPLVHSISMLQSAQLALQTEVQMFGEIGKGICSLCDESDNTDTVISLDPLDGWTEIDHAYLRKIIQTLNEAETGLKEKELRITELETTMKTMDSSQQSITSATEMETELQDLFKQKLEAQVQSVVMKSSFKEFNVLVQDKIKLLKDHNSLSNEQPQNVESKADIGKGQPDNNSDTPYGGAEIQKMQKGVVKFTKYLIIQLVLLVLVFVLFVLQLGPKSVVVVPT